MVESVGNECTKWGGYEPLRIKFMVLRLQIRRYVVELIIPARIDDALAVRERRVRHQ